MRQKLNNPKIGGCVMIRTVCAIVFALLLLLTTAAPAMADSADLRSTSTVTRTVNVDIVSDPSLAALTTGDDYNLVDSSTALNNETWDSFRAGTADGRWVGPVVREAQVELPVDAQSNGTYAAVTRFGPDEIGGGISEGWVRAPFPTKPPEGGTENPVNMEIYHVDNPSLVSLVPGEGAASTVQDVDVNWSTAGDYIASPAQPEIAGGDAVVAYGSGTPSNWTQTDGNLHGWDVMQESGDGAVAMAQRLHPYSGDNISANLTGWWQMGERVDDSCGGGADVCDRSGEDNHGTRTGATWTANGRIGGALDFDGSGDKIDIGDTNDLGINDFTISFWMEKATPNSNIFNIIRKYQNSSNYYTIQISSLGKKLEFRSIVNGATEIRIKTTQWALHQNTNWNYYTIVVDRDNSSNSLWYVNGVVASSYQNQFASTANLDNTANLKFEPTENIKLDEITFWNRALSASEITTLSNPPFSAAATYRSSHGSAAGVESASSDLSTAISINAIVSLPGGDPNVWPGGNTSNASISEVRLYNSATSSYAAASLVKTWTEGIDYNLLNQTGQQWLNLSATVGYRQYWFWAMDLSSAGNHTAVIHSMNINLWVLAPAPFLSVISPLAGPTLIWSYNYTSGATDPRHAHYDERSYYSFTTPIYPSRDLDGDGLPDDGYVWLFRLDGRSFSTGNPNHNLYLTSGDYGLGYGRSVLSEFDPFTGNWFNDTLPETLNIALSWLFTEGMGAGVRGVEIPAGTDWITFWHKLDTPFNKDTDYLTFLMPFVYSEASGVTNLHISASAFDANKVFLDYAFCFPLSKTLDFILCSGDGGGANEWVRAPNSLDGAVYIRFEVTFDLNPIEDGRTAKIWVYDNNSNFDNSEPELLNRFWFYSGAVEQPIIGPYDNMFAFRPYFAVQVTDSYWSNTDIANQFQTSVGPTDAANYPLIPQQIDLTANFIFIAEAVTLFAIDQVWSAVTALPAAAIAGTTRALTNQWDTAARNYNFMKTNTCNGVNNIPPVAQAAAVHNSLTDFAMRSALAACGIKLSPEAIAVKKTMTTLMPAWKALAEFGYTFIEFEIAVISWVANFVVDELQNWLFIFLQAAVGILKALDIVIMVIVVSFAVTLVRLAVWGEWERVNRVALRGLTWIPYLGPLFMFLSVDTQSRCCDGCGDK